MINPTGLDVTMTRRALLAEREKDAVRLRAKWKARDQEEAQALMTKEAILAAEGAG